MSYHGLDRQRVNRQLDPQHGGHGPAVASGHDPEAVATNGSQTGANTSHPAAIRVYPLHLAALVDVHSVRGGPLGQPPDHRVVPHDPPRRMVQSGMDRESGTVGDVEPGDQLRALLRVEQLRLHPHEVVRAGRHAEPGHRGLAVPQEQVPAAEEHEVEVELAGEDAPQLQPLVVQPHVLGGALVGSHDGGIAPRPAETDVVRLQDRHVADAVVAREVVGGRETVDAAADDHHVVVALERRGTPEATEPEPVHVGRTPGGRATPYPITE